ncbi:squalene/phytoene synthase family protein [Rhodobacteraceae bacterium M382]|nr:squalene/phytoene synthase family protein [Rhodobacteraceae bacterium M382]
MQFDDDLIACADLVRKGDPQRFRAVMAAPVTARPALFALYAFNVELSRAPWASAESMIAEMRVQWWRDVGAEIAGGGPVRRHFVATPLARVLPAHLATLIDPMAEARRWDIYRDPFEDEAALDAYLEATSGALTWMAAAMLGAADEEVARDFGYAVGVSKYLQAIPDLEAHKRIPLPDGRMEAVSALARKGLSRLENARKIRARISKAASPAFLVGWETDALLNQASDTPERVADGTLGIGEFQTRCRLLWRTATGRW